MRARSYEPQLGSFTSRDPLFANTDQAYVYARGDPVNTTDPSGLDASGCTGAPAGLSGTWGYCIGIVGDGTIVQQIKTSAYTTYSGCSVAQILINGVVTFQKPEVCYDANAGPSPYTASPDVGIDPITFLTGRHLTAQWGCSDASVSSGNWNSSACHQLYSANGITPFKAGDQVCEQYTGTGISGSSSYNSSTPRACETIGSNTSEGPLGTRRVSPLPPRLPNPLPPLPGFAPATLTAYQQQDC